MNTRVRKARGIARIGIGALLLLSIWNCILSTGGHPMVLAASPWIPAVRLSLPGSEAHHPTLSVASDGTIHILWEQSSEGKPYLWHTRWQGERWQGPDRLLVGQSPSVTASGDLLHLAYVNEHEGWQRVYYANWRNGAWSLPVAVSSDGARCLAPSLAVDGAGRVSIIWVRYTASGQPRLCYAARDDAGNWTEQEIYPYSGVDSRGTHPALAADSAGRLHAAWEAPHNGNPTTDIYYAWRSDRGWTIPHYVSYSPSVPSSAPDIAVDATGVAHFVWQEGATGASEVYYHRDVARLGSDGGEMLSTGERKARSPHLVIDARGALHALWDEGTTLRYRRGTVGANAWQPIETVASALAVQEPAIAAGGEGAVHAAWAQREPNGALAIYYSQRPADAPTPTPTASDPTETPTAIPPSATASATPTQLPSATTTATVPPATPSATSPAPTATLMAPSPAASATSTPDPVPPATSAPSPTPSATATVMPPPATLAPSPYPGPSTQTPALPRTPGPEPTATPTRGTPMAYPQHAYLPRVEQPSIADPHRTGVSGTSGIETPPSIATAAASSTPASGPTPAPVLLSDPVVSARRPAIAIARDGAVHVVWEQGEELYHTYRQGGNWSTPARVATGNSPALAASPDGSLHLAFVNEFGGNYEIYHVRWDGVRWSLPRNVSRTSSGASSLPDIAVAPDGSAHIVWTETLPGYPVIYYARGYPGWFDSMPVPNARGSAPAVALTGDESGVAVHLAWQDQDTDTPALEVYYSVFENGTWALAQNVSASPDTDSRQPDIAAEGNEVRLVWQEALTSQTVRAIRGHDGWWPFPVAVSPEAESAYLPAVASDGAITHVAWDTTTAVRLSQTWSSSSVWPQPVSLIEGVAEATDVVVAATSVGEAHVAWAQRNGEDWSIYYTCRTFYAPFSRYLGLVMR